MKATFELTVDWKGTPMIQFRHDQTSNELEQKLLRVLINSFMNDGIDIQNISGYASTEGERHENYILIPKEKQIKTATDEKSN